MNHMVVVFIKFEGGVGGGGLAKPTNTKTY